MIRFLFILLLLVPPAIVQAQSLYKWTEPDGSITFSLKPPPDGVDYETVKADKSPQIVASEADGDDQRAAEGVTSNNETAAAGAQTLAPVLAVQSDVTRPYSEEPQALNDENNPVPLDADRVEALNAQVRKRRQCEDLLKRVLSLESRLRSRLTPDDMDNTVFHMARYQRSYDQHCDG